MIASGLLGALPLALAATLLVLPPGRFVLIAERMTGLAVLAAAVFLLAQNDDAAPNFRVDGLGAVVASLVAIDALARQAHLGPIARDDRIAEQVGFAARLLACLFAEPLAAWVTLTIAVSAAIYPRIMIDWHRVPLAAACAGLAFFGTIVEMIAPGPVPVGCALVGYAVLTAISPSIAAPVVVLVFRLEPEARLPDLLVVMGLLGMLACTVSLYLRPALRRRHDWVFLGHIALAIVTIGLDGTDVRFVALLLLVLATLTNAAILFARPAHADRLVATMGLGAVLPVGVFPALLLMILAVAERSAWLLLPVGGLLAAMAWAMLSSLPARKLPASGPPASVANRGRTTPAPSPAWLVMLLTVLVGWLMPADAADWLHAVAAGVR